jgi:hypothetical protein
MAKVPTNTNEANANMYRLFTALSVNTLQHNQLVP